ncbi:HDOD domain-containing protein [Thiohalophilus thiocyanatoxydans]|uniref:Putative nucleotidyltransferase with HDIG domain n=1 Tax=Thiohalophilus thiocyanatoxydans TaxID=381308 RepID=A0A4V3H4R7_9GAMM|nr:HDOD domain-containing protein [Thiohalophilus thiocyanatoxydans]TDY04245.1 putative nucleotidyltransferase with HDIG domain [Thiohalophilus thiocyanatoxydans]
MAPAIDPRLYDRLEEITLPGIVARLNTMINDLACSTADIAGILQQDTTLTNRILKIVNSPFYNLPPQIDDISTAITLVGPHGLRDIVMATALIRQYNQFPEGVVTPEQFWRHSLAVASAARTVGERMQIANTERLFIAGLLHDMGKLVMYLLGPEKSREVLARARQGENRLCHIERDLFGADHAEVGALLLHQWRMPEAVIEAVALHHQPALAKHDIRQSAIVYLANAIGNTIEAPISPNADLPVDTRIWDMLDLDPGEGDDLTDESRQTLQYVLQAMHPELTEC